MVDRREIRRTLDEMNVSNKFQSEIKSTYKAVRGKVQMAIPISDEFIKKKEIKEYN